MTNETRIAAAVQELDALPAKDRNIAAIARKYEVERMTLSNRFHQLHKPLVERHNGRLLSLNNENTLIH